MVRSGLANTLLLPGVSSIVANLPLKFNLHKRIILPRLTAMYRKSVPFADDRPVKDQHRWVPLSALLGPSSTLPTDITINYPRSVGTADTAERWDVLLVEVTVS